MKKFIFIIIILLGLMFGCTLSFNFKSNMSLIRDYQFSQKSNDFIIFYNVKKSDNIKIVDVVLKNNKNYVMSNLKLRVKVKNISDKYFYISRLKSLNIKKLTLKIPADVKYIAFDYEYSLEQDDSFLRPSYRNNEQKYNFKGSFELFIK